MLSLLLDFLSRILSFCHTPLPSCYHMYADPFVDHTCIFRNRMFLTVSAYFSESESDRGHLARNGFPEPRKVQFRVNVGGGAPLLFFLHLSHRTAHGSYTVRPVPTCDARVGDGCIIKTPSARNLPSARFLPPPSCQEAELSPQYLEPRRWRAY